MFLALTILWDYHKRQKTIAKTTDELSADFHENIRSGRIPYRRCRARGKQLKDAEHLDAYRERKRIFQEAFHDNVDSIGELDALTDSPILGISRAEVLRDPKVRVNGHPYVHPGLRVRP